MSPLSSSIALIPLIVFPALTSALVGISWTITNTPVNGLQDITFPISMPNAPHRSGYFFAQQFGFLGALDVGYTGLQPRSDSSGASIIHAAFSSFISGTTTTNTNCQSGADGGPGVSCAVEIPSSYSDQYLLEVKNVGDTTWRGTLINNNNGESTIIGEYTLPSGIGRIVGGQVGFVEYYPWNSGGHTCSSLPKTEVLFGVPVSKTAGAGEGILSDAYEYGDCVGQVDFEMRRVARGVDVTVGF